jgi:dipeptidyl aminopeptidase/acylaminoacyl peptidase
MIGLSLSVALLLTSAGIDSGQSDDAPPGNVSFMKDVAPVLVRNCIACHNARKAEGKYTMTNFAALAKGGPGGVAIAPGDSDESNLISLIQHDAEPRMPFKQAPLPKESIDLLTRWVVEGAKYDGIEPSEDWPALLHRLTVVVVPEAYPVRVPVTALAFSPDGTQLATSGYHEINLWNKESGVLGRRLRGVAERVYDVAYSADGRWLATASGDPGQFGRATLWIAEPDGGGKPARELVESNDCIFAVAISPDGKRVACAGADRSIRVYSTETQALICTIEDHADWILDLAFSPDGKLLASASRDKTSKVFDVEKKESLVTFPGHGEAVTSVAWLPDGKTIVTGGADNQLRWWKPEEDAKQTRNTGGFGGTIFQLKLSPDGKTLVACCADKSVRLVDAEKGNITKNMQGHTDWVYTVAFSPDGQSIASGAWDGTVLLWKLGEDKPLRTIVAAPGQAATPSAN